MRKIFIWSSFAYFFSIPLSQYVSVRLLLLISLLSIIIFYRERIFLETFRRCWDLYFYFLVLIAGLFYSEDKVQGLKVLETSFSLIAVPFLFYGLSRSKNNISKYSLAFFTMGTLTACIIMISAAIVRYFASYNYEVIQYYHLTNVLGLQPTYLAYYIIASVTYIVFILYYNKNLSVSILSMAALFLFIVLLLTGGKTAFISLILVFSFFFLKYLLDAKSFRKTFTIVLVVLIVLSFIFINSSGYFVKDIHNNDFWERSVLWKAAVNANPNPLMGVGTGDYKSVLNEYYVSEGLSEFADGNYNSHNQFIHRYFSNGILGLIALLIIMGRPLYLSFKNQNPIGILILFPFVIYGMTEVFLGRYQGVAFFILCHQIAVSQYFSSKINFTLKASQSSGES